MNDEDHDADWRYVTPSTIPLGSDVIAVGIIYNANTVSLKVVYPAILGDSVSPSPEFSMYLRNAHVSRTARPPDGVIANFGV